MRKSLLMVACVVAMLAGCTKEIPIVSFPEFWTPELKSIAVMPFKADSRQQLADGEGMADELANALRANGTYKVFNPSEVKSMLKVKDLQIFLGDDKTAMDAQLAKFEGLDVQAVLIGRITQSTATTRDEQKADPIMVWDPYRKMMVPSGSYNYYVLTRNEANVKATASLLRAKDGRTIHATQMCGYQAWAQGSPPAMDRNACHTAAVSQTINQMVAEFAVTRQTIEVKPDEVFKLSASDKCYDGKWDERKSFRANDKLYVVLNMPARADRNKFRVAIVRSDRKQDLASQELLWSRGNPQTGVAVSFDLSDIAAKGGKGAYTAKLYTMLEAQPALTMDFTVE